MSLCRGDGLIRISGSLQPNIRLPSTPGTRRGGGEVSPAPSVRTRSAFGRPTVFMTRVDHETTVAFNVFRFQGTSASVAGVEENAHGAIILVRDYQVWEGVAVEIADGNSVRSHPRTERGV